MLTCDGVAVEASSEDRDQMVERFLDCRCVILSVQLGYVVLGMSEQERAVLRHCGYTEEEHVYDLRKPESV